MNKQSTLYQYTQPAKKRLVAILVFLALVVGCVIGAAAAKANWQMPDPVPMTADVESGTYCSIEVQYMSDWILKVSGDDNYTYYEAGDPDGNWFSVRLTDAEYAQFEEIVAYTYSEAAEPVPETITITGMTHLVPSDDMENLADVYEVSIDEYESVFGACYLNMGSEPTAPNVMWTLGAVLFGFVLLVAFIEYRSIRKMQKRNLETLVASDTLAAAEADIESEGKRVFEKQNLTLGERYVFGGGSGIILPYDDILWMYKHVTRRLFVIVSTSLVAHLYNGKTVVLSKRGLKDDVIAEIATAMLEKNSELMIGFTGENRRIYREKVKEYKKSVKA